MSDKLNDEVHRINTNILNIQGRIISLERDLNLIKNSLDNLNKVIIRLSNDVRDIKDEVVK